MNTNDTPADENLPTNENSLVVEPGRLPIPIPPRPRRILCFLQNQWYHNPERIQAMMDDWQGKGPNGDRFKTKEACREFYIKTFLFFGCRTGKNLREAFGEELCDEIVWEEQSPLLGSKASSYFPADFAHIGNVLTRHDPTHVIALGKAACGALYHLHHARKSSWTYYMGPHPTARMPDVIECLKQIPRLLAANMVEREEQNRLNFRETTNVGSVLDYDQKISNLSPGTLPTNSPTPTSDK